MVRKLSKNLEVLGKLLLIQVVLLKIAKSDELKDKDPQDPIKQNVSWCLNTIEHLCKDLKADEQGIAPSDEAG